MLLSSEHSIESNCKRIGIEENGFKDFSVEDLSCSNKGELRKMSNYVIDIFQTSYAASMNVVPSQVHHLMALYQSQCLEIYCIAKKLSM